MKRLLLAGLLALGASAASAQASLSNNPQAASARVQNFRSNGAENSGFGIKGGVNLCDALGDGASKMYKDPGWLTQYHFGAYAQIGITNTFSIQPEVLYQRKGFKGTEVLASGSTEAEEKSIKLSYLSVPLLFVFNPFDNLAIQIGPQASYLLNVRDGGSSTVDADAYHYKQLDLGVVGGLEAKFEFLRVGARYDYSVTDLRDEGQFQDGVRQAYKDINNGVFQIYLGVGL